MVGVSTCCPLLRCSTTMTDRKPDSARGDGVAPGGRRCAGCQEPHASPPRPAFPPVAGRFQPISQSHPARRGPVDRPRATRAHDTPAIPASATTESKGLGPGSGLPEQLGTALDTRRMPHVQEQKGFGWRAGKQIVPAPAAFKNLADGFRLMGLDEGDHRAFAWRCRFGVRGILFG
jgi:hypothetical protein